MSRANFSKIADQIEKDGFARGYRQAVKDMRRLLGGTLDDMLKGNQAPERPTGDARPDWFGRDGDSIIVTQAKVAGGVPKSRKPSAEDRVFEIIKAIPGLRGTMVVTSLAETGEPVKERTVRTALWRLKDRKVIEQRGREWYVTPFGNAWYATPAGEKSPPP